MVPEFYRDCEIFFTGGSGVVGEAAIEKLLRSCDVKKIYLLLRGKRNLSVEQRLEKFKQSKIFRVLKTKKPDELNKVVAVPGDAMLPLLGITPHYAKMMENVSVVFHCAATVRFNETLQVAMKVNVGGTLEALRFAETLKNLKIFMHVSTYFSNTNLTFVEPKLYPPPMDWRVLYKLVEDEQVDQEVVNALTNKIIVGFPNTYCFTKNLAENVVNEYRDRLPVTIYRPSIVIMALTEPEPGYPPALMGAMGLFVLAGAGLVKTVYMDEAIRLDMTPLDMGTVVMLTTAFMAAEQYKAGEVTDIPVFMFSSSKLLSYTFRDIGHHVMKEKIWEKYAYDKSFLLPGCYFTASKLLYNILCFTHEIIPAVLADSLLKLFGRKPVLLGIVRKAIITLKIMEPFLFNNYDSDGINRFDEIRQITDGTEFSLEKHIELTKDLHTCCINMVKKTREVLLNEDESSRDRARRVMRIKKFIYNGVRAVLAYYLLRWFCNVILNFVQS